MRPLASMFAAEIFTPMLVSARAKLPMKKEAIIALINFFISNYL